MATCDINALARDGSCFFCLPPGYYYPIKLALLARWLKQLDTNADTSVNGLLSQASCFTCLTPGEVAAARLALLCGIASGGGGSGPNPPLTPNAPTGLNILITSATDNVQVRWTAPASGPSPTSYDVYRSDDFGVSFFLLANVPTASLDDQTGMVFNDFWIYKVQARIGSNTSSFTTNAAASYVFDGQIDTTTQADPFFPILFDELDHFDVQASVTRTSLSLGNFLKCAGDFLFNGCTNLTTVTIPNLASVGGDFNGNSSGITSLSAPALASIGNTVDLSSCTALSSVSCPVLATAGGSVDLSSDTALTTISMPLLTTVGGDFTASGDAAVTLLNLSAVTTIGGALSLDSINVASIAMPLLTSINGAVSIQNCPSLTSISFAVLASVLSDFICDISKIVTVSFPNLTFTEGTTISFFSCNLSAASVNHILARGIASGVMACTFTLNGAGNAAPTGQGIIDAGILSGLGNTVTTN